MPKRSFILKEESNQSRDLLKLNIRLFKSLPLFIKCLPVTIFFVIASSVTPSIFRWYAGKYTASSSGFDFNGLAQIVVFGIIFRVLAWACFEVTGMWSSQRLYLAMIQGLSKVRVTFFDENPSGRIINRLIRDYDEVRSTAIIFVGDFLNATVEVLSIAAVACIASPWAAVAVFPLLGIFFFIQSQRAVMIEHCRGLSALAASHVLNRKNDLIEGREIFVLYEKSGHLLDRMMESLRVYLRSSIWTMRVDAWSSFWIRFFAEVFSLVVLLFLVGALSLKQIDIPLAGVIISALFGITGSIGWLDFSSSMVSRSAPHVRRVFEYMDLPDESKVEKVEISKTEGFAAPSSKAFVSDFLNFPLGDIVFSNYSMAYREGLPLILKDLDLVIPGKSKTALVGRTGAGKSSVVQALFRMVHVVKGDIQLGGQSIFNVEVNALRQSMGVVPQFPYLFAGTLRSNLDRGGYLPEDQLLNALEAVRLSYPLDYAIREGGLNLSLGERQLLCLARVIASGRSIILMDEPTSGLDPQTDFRINRILQTALKDKTVITIAHRRESLENYDLIVEMNAGKVRRIYHE